ncbi:MAG: GNAT family N-acetyltransferase [Clostridium sp.]|uniref:GNAT family N-acetyltransferase n=1 Tax=Clostridium sp. TaxID=1506 RepID=UPI00291034DA|nr:GNAT family N-acetyltransferase [Clostridium sp.]MDU7337403.1 GNAT family N-acetyltransferase [Clostridium sp.]
MEFTKEDNRIFSNDETGKLIAEITFPNISSTTVDINHTFVDDSLRGQGVAGKLMLAAVDSIRAQGKKAIATCPYAVAWFEKNNEFSNLLDSEISRNK